MLNERAMLVQLRRSRPRLTTRDKAVEEFVQSELGDKAYTLNKRLFRDPTNPVRFIMTAYDRTYVAHTHNTQPYVDGGPRLLAMDHYPTYRERVTTCIDEMDRLIQTHVPDEDAYWKLVQKDIDFRNEQEILHGLTCEENRRRANAVPPSLSEYPSFVDFKTGIAVSMTFTTLPDAPHVLFDEDKQEVERRHAEIAQRAQSDAILRMLEPVRHLSSKLAIPIKEKGSVFRDSALQNIKDSIDHVQRIAVNITPEVKAVIEELQQAVDEYDAKKDWLRESPYNRQLAQARFSEIERKFDSFNN